LNVANFTAPQSFCLRRYPVGFDLRRRGGDREFPVLGRGLLRKALARIRAPRLAHDVAGRAVCGACHSQIVAPFDP